jgi:hypothetical protein
MKRYSVAAFAWFASTLLFGAQAKAQAQFGVGPIVGVNFGTFSFSPASYSPASIDPAGKQKGRTGLMFGAQAEIGFGNMFFIVLQPGYVGKGYGITDPHGTRTVSIDEVEIPILLKVKFLDGVVRPYLFAGPNVTFLLSAIEIYSFPDQIVPYQNLRSNTQTDFAVDFGGGAEFDVAPMLDITADVRYSLGLASLINSASYMESPPVTTKASGFQILVGAMFHVQ